MNKSDRRGLEEPNTAPSISAALLLGLGDGMRAAWLSPFIRVLALIGAFAGALGAVVSTE